MQRPVSERAHAEQARWGAPSRDPRELSRASPMSAMPRIPWAVAPMAVLLANPVESKAIPPCCQALAEQPACRLSRNFRAWAARLNRLATASAWHAPDRCCWRWPPCRQWQGIRRSCAATCSASQLTPRVAAAGLQPVASSALDVHRRGVRVAGAGLLARNRAGSRRSCTRSRSGTPLPWPARRRGG